MTEETEFARFWAEYPKKRSKGTAFKAWCETKERRPHVEKIIKTLIVMKASPGWMKDAGEYIPYPATWLRAWGWEDVAEVDLKDVTRDGKMWWQSASAIEARAHELGMQWSGQHGGRTENFQQFTARVRARAERNVASLDDVRDKKLASAGG